MTSPNHTHSDNDSQVWYNSTEIRGQDTSSNSHSSSFYISLGLITLPGIITNTMALYFIIRDMKKAIFPAIILILALCTSDLIAVIFSATRHIVTRYVTDISYNMCASISVPHTFFRVYCGVLNAMMAADRVLAISYPFYYKTNIEVVTWKIGCFVAAFSTACFSLFPVIGLGDVMKTITASSGVQINYCSTFSYRPEPIKKVYGLMFGIVGVLVVCTIVFGNVLVIRSILRLNNRVVSVGSSSDQALSCTRSSRESGSLTTNSVTSFEIAFAKLMGGLAAVYLICEVPYSTLILMQQFDMTVDRSVKGLIHMFGGLSYSCDPIVYILIRKVKVKRILCYIFRCRNREVSVVTLRNVEAIPPT